jgi:hypothetical protein
LDFWPFFKLFCATDLVGENLQDVPVVLSAIIGQFVNLAIVVLPVR